MRVSCVQHAAGSALLAQQVVVPTAVSLALAQRVTLAVGAARELRALALAGTTIGLARGRFAAAAGTIATHLGAAGEDDLGVDVLADLALVAETDEGPASLVGGAGGVWFEVDLWCLAGGAAAVVLHGADG